MLTFNPMNWWIQGPLSVRFFFIVMQFSGKIGQSNRLVLPSFELATRLPPSANLQILYPPLQQWLASSASVVLKRLRTGSRAETAMVVTKN